jgi:hypothetical protein
MRISLTLLLIVLCGCATPKQVTTPSAGVSTSQIMPQVAVAQLKRQPITCTNCTPYYPPNYPIYWLHWTKSPTPNVMYQVWETTNLYQPFHLAATISSNNWAFNVTNAPMGLFKVRSVNPKGQVSIWATT